MLVHFFIDEKVTDQVIENFERLTDNTYLVFKDSSQSTFKYTKTKAKNVVAFDKDEDDINQILSELGCKGLIVHSFNSDFAKVILEIKLDIKIGWFPWGYDIYFLPKIRPNIYGPLTKKLLSRLHAFWKYENFIKKNRILRIAYNRLLRGKADPYSLIEEGSKRIKYFFSYIKEDYFTYSEYYGNNLQYIESAFCDLEQYLAGNANISINSSAEGILIGNSNSSECNHLEAFDILKKSEISLDHSLIYVPLSYGTDNLYRDEIVLKGQDLFKRRFVPMMDFMLRTEYLEVLKSCSTGIFYHYRQQAMGNILAMLYMGCRIYLSSKNPVFDYLKRMNVHVYDFDIEYSEYRNSKLNDIEVQDNRRILERLFSKGKISDDLSNVINLLIN